MIEIVIIGLMLVFLIEIEYRLKLNKMFAWLLNKPIESLSTLFIMCGAISLLALMMPMMMASGFVTLLILGLAYANKYKIKFRGDPFFPWDLKLGKESSDMSDYIKEPAVIGDGLMGVLLLTVVVDYSRFSHLSNWQLSLLAIIGIVILGIHIMVYHRQSPELVSQQTAFLDKKGVLIAFFINLWSLVYVKKESTGFKSGEANTESENPKMNLIVIMNESFWDVGRLPNVSFSKPLTPTLDRLRKEAVYGDMVSPEFGGGTSNIEFEYLTGLSMRFLPVGSMAFQSYLKRPIPALPNHLKSLGYQTIGLHSYERWFWRRDKVYHLMGFDQFVTRESFDTAKIKGKYISDLSFADKVIETYEKASQPLFIYGITMQNHGPHHISRYKDYDFDLTSNKLSPKELGEVKAYAQGIMDADASLDKLVTYFSQCQSPTTIVFFGDHLPMLGGRFQTYEKTGFIKHKEASTWTYEEQVKMASTPFVIWSNQSQQSQDMGPVSPAKLNLEVLKRSGIPLSAHFQTIDAFYKEQDIINHRIKDINHSDLSAYKAYQNHLLFGKSEEVLVVEPDVNLLIK